MKGNESDCWTHTATYCAGFREDRAAAEQLMKVGESPYDQTLDLAELAAYTVVANALLQLDETITRN